MAPHVLTSLSGLSAVCVCACCHAYTPLLPAIKATVTNCENTRSLSECAAFVASGITRSPFIGLEHNDTTHNQPRMVAPESRRARASSAATSWCCPAQLVQFTDTFCRPQLQTSNAACTH